MVTVGVPGFSAMGGVQFSNTAVIAGAAALLAFIAANKFFDSSPVGKAGMARAFVADADYGSLEQRLVNIIVKRSADKTTAMNNVDRIRAQVRLYQQRLQKIADDRRTGKLTHAEVRTQLREMVKQIAAELGIGMRKSEFSPNPYPWAMWKAMHPGRGNAYGRTW